MRNVGYEHRYNEQVLKKCSATKVCIALKTSILGAFSTSAQGEVQLNFPINFSIFTGLKFYV